MRLTVSKLRKLIREAISDMSTYDNAWLIRQSQENEFGGYDVWKYGPINADSEEEAEQIALQMVKSGEVARLGSSYVKVEPLSDVIKNPSSFDAEKLSSALKAMNSARLSGEEDVAAESIAGSMIYLY